MPSNPIDQPQLNQPLRGPRGLGPRRAVKTAIAARVITEASEQTIKKVAGELSSRFKPLGSTTL